MLFPDSVERQNVMYVRNLFDEINSMALIKPVDMLGDNALSKKLFIDALSKWCKIVNVKNPEKGIHVNDNISNPYKSI